MSAPDEERSDGVAYVGLMTWSEREGLAAAYRRAMQTAEIGNAIAMFFHFIVWWYEYDYAWGRCPECLGETPPTRWGEDVER